jgi:hypothetical protein
MNNKQPIQSIFEHLRSVEIDPKHIEKKEAGKNKDGTTKYLNYLSWAYAWQYVKSHYPDANYSVREWDNKPYLFDEHLGYLVETSVTIQGHTISMRLPVMDSSNKAQRHIAYSYKTKFGDKTVEPATMFDINTAIMRCLAKNIAMFGLGLSLYLGEDIPEDVEEHKQKNQTKPTLWLNPNDENWSKVVNALAKGLADIDKVKIKYNFSQETKDKLLKEVEQLKAQINS